MVSKDKAIEEIRKFAQQFESAGNDEGLSAETLLAFAKMRETGSNWAKRRPH